jgi:hypothetical protein
MSILPQTSFVALSGILLAEIKRWPLTEATSELIFLPEDNDDNVASPFG